MQSNAVDALPLPPARPQHQQLQQASTPARPRPNRQFADSPRVIHQTDTVRITFEVEVRHAPALRSAVEEISNEVGGRLEGPHSFAKEQALTDAAIALGALRAAVNAKVAAGDPHYD